MKYILFPFLSSKVSSRLVMLICFCFASLSIYSQKNKVSLAFEVSMNAPSTHQYHVVFNGKGFKEGFLELGMPAWTTGYYQLMNFANNVENFQAFSGDGRELRWKKTGDNTWRIHSLKYIDIKVTYDVKATRNFVAGNYLDEERGYISPAGIFMYPKGLIKNEVTVSIEKYKNWSKIATGLPKVKGTENTYYAKDYDVLYDSPILIGNLESFPSFTVKGIPHYFEAYKAGKFDRQQFMNDLQKIVSTASGIIGDIPYTDYTFIAIGPGGGGIEHLNSTSIAFSGDELNNRESRIRTYNFLAHEYFHHYNVKRIRPIELGPFDYEKGSRTKMLWLSEGLTVYYEYLILKRAGLTTTDEILKTFQESIKAYESKPGRQFQTPADASWKTWDEGPFGRTSDEVNKTISPYDKGALLGMLLDFKIRQSTKNEKSLDDLMRLLYNKYYKQKNRGFTEDEFRTEAEKLAKTSLQDFFDYIYTLKTVDYPTYLNYAGLKIDTVAHALPTAWAGLSVRDRNDSLIVNNVDWLSPAWNSGLRRRNTILEVDGQKINAKTLNEIVSKAQAGDKIKIRFETANGIKEEELIFAIKKESSYAITPVENPTPLQSKILKSWLGE
ncbi:M61 family metallopeptidase [Emticicia sp. C21]|uniref:M61 family metallopeptidase n=1 Tax=Emticicia sp. C21 TaxID=2302915 RepID=UPI000E353B82|nr:PDZ domain-containing protein [Emticicia sp. C21]RFS17770.1 M61 family peptidase [Emticicia sp. C21]